MKSCDVGVIGSGVAGISALIWLKRLGLHAVMFEKNSSIGGQLINVHNRIIDYPALYGLTGNEMITQLTSHLEALQCEWQTNVHVLSLDTEKEHVVLKLSRNSGTTEMISSRYVIIATGAQEQKLSIPGEDKLDLYQGSLSTSKDISVFKNKKVIIIGGGDRACIGANRIKDIAQEVILIHRRASLTGRKELIDPLLQSSRITIKPHSVVTEIIWKNKKIELVKIKDLSNQKEVMIQADIVLIRIGIEPILGLLKQYLSKEDTIIPTNNYGKTQFSDRIYAIGDASHSPHYSSISASVGEGMLAAKDISLHIRKE